MTKNIYLAASYEESGKNYACVLKVSCSENLLACLDRKGIKIAQPCGTKKEAENIVNFWNDCYKNNKTYYFDN